MDELWKYEEDFVRQYENVLAYPRATNPIRENTKKIFGDDIIVYVDFPKKYIRNRYYGLTPIKSTKKFIEDVGLGIYSTKKGAESMIKNKIKEDDKK